MSLNTMSRIIIIFTPLFSPEVLQSMRKIVFLFISFILCLPGYGQKAKEIMYVGTFPKVNAPGTIYIMGFDRAKGKLKLIDKVQTLPSPSYLEIDPTGRFLYAVNRGSVEEMKTW